MNRLFLLAHDEKFHNKSTSSFEHYLTQPFVAVGLYLALSGLLVFFAHKYAKKQIITLVIVFNLISGALAYGKVPIVGILSLTVVIAAIVTLVLELISKRK